MWPQQIGGSALRTEVGPTDALSQSDFLTAKHGEGKPDSSASHCPRVVGRLAPPSPAAAVIVPPYQAALTWAENAKSWHSPSTGESGNPQQVHGGAYLTAMPIHGKMGWLPMTS